MTTSIQIINGQPMIALSPEAMNRLAASGKSEVSLIPSPNGVEIVADVELARQLEVARGVMDDDQEALSELAK